MMNLDWLKEVKEDAALSPFTGWTRDHWMRVVEKMLLGVLKHIDPETHRCKLPLTTDSSIPPAVGTHEVYMKGEVLGRPMMLAAIYMRATGKTTIDGYEGDIGETFRSAIKALMKLDPLKSGNKDFYYIADVGLQLSLFLAWDYLYEPLDDESKKTLREQSSSTRQFTTDTNWMYFDLTQRMLLRRMGEPYDAKLAADQVRALLNMYRGDGWFIDGWNQQFDYYNFWGFQLYSHLLISEGEEAFVPYRSMLKDITALHEQSIQYFIDADGDLIPRGRSMCYRFAAVSGIQWSQISGLNGMNAGLARRISSGCIKSFLEHGCLRDDGSMSIGYWGENTAVGEDYNSPGGPYFAITGLMALILPDEHAFWSEKEEASAADSDNVSKQLIHGAQMTLKTGGERRESRLYSAGELFRHAGVWDAGIKYYQHTYSSKIGSVISGNATPTISAGKTGISSDGKDWVYRTKPRMITLNEERCKSEWNPGTFKPDYQGTVVTESIFLEEGELHVFTHFASEAQYLRFGGWSIRLQNESEREEPQLETFPNGATSASSTFNHSVILPLSEWSGVEGEVKLKVLEPIEGYVHSHTFDGVGAWLEWTSSNPIEPGTPVAIFVDAYRAQPTVAPADLDLTALADLANSAQLDRK